MYVSAADNDYMGVLRACRRQRVGARNVSGKGAQGHGVALQLEAFPRKLAEATELWLWVGSSMIKVYHYSAH